MKNMRNYWLSGTSMVFVMMLIVQSCSKDAAEELPQADAQLSQTELQAIIESDTYSSVADDVIAEVYENGQSTSGKVASSDCYSAEYTETGFTLTFNNCVLNGTENVNGTVVVQYITEGETATLSANYEAFYVGNIELNGTRTLSYTASGNSSAISFSVVSDMTVTLADGSTISENGTKTVAFNFGDTLTESSVSIDGNWTVEYDGNTYTVAVLESLTAIFDCGSITSGMMTVTKNGLEIDVDFGDGTCDKEVILIYPNGATETYTLD